MPNQIKPSRLKAQERFFLHACFMIGFFTIAEQFKSLDKEDLMSSVFLTFSFFALSNCVLESIHGCYSAEPITNASNSEKTLFSLPKRSALALLEWIKENPKTTLVGLANTGANALLWHEHTQIKNKNTTGDIVLFLFSIGLFAFLSLGFLIALSNAFTQQRKADQTASNPTPLQENAEISATP